MQCPLRAFLGALVLSSALVAAAPARYARYDEIEPVLQTFSDPLPIELRALPSLLPERPWAEWIGAHDSRIRGRLARGTPPTKTVTSSRRTNERPPL